MQRSVYAVLFVLCLGCSDTEPETPAPAVVLDAGLVADASQPLDASSVLLPGNGQSADQAALSCETLSEEFPDLPSDTYWLNPIGGSTDNAFAAYCDFDADDGPWTLIVKIDGNETTFKYDEAIWVNQLVLNEEDTAPGEGQMKNHGYSMLPFTSIRIGMRVDAEAEEGDGETRYLSMDVGNTSMRRLMVRGDEIETSFGRDRWRELIPLTSLQPNCNAEGINIRSKLRFGLLGNEQDDCHTPDSYIGIGSERDQVVAGNFAVGRWQSDQGDRRTNAYAEIWIKNADALSGVLP